MDVQKNIRDWEDYFNVSEENKMNQSEIDIIKNVFNLQEILKNNETKILIETYIQDEKGNKKKIDYFYE